MFGIFQYTFDNIWKLNGCLGKNVSSVLFVRNTSIAYQKYDSKEKANSISTSVQNHWSFLWSPYE